MYASEYDAERLILFSLHLGDPLSDADVKGIEASIGRLVADASARGDAPATSVVIVETQHLPNAAQRKRIGEAVNRLGRGWQTMVPSSLAARAVMTAIRWFAPPGPGKEDTTYASYDDARAWLVARTGHDGAVFDAMLSRLRARCSKSQVRHA